MAEIFRLKDCIVTNLYNSFTDEHYDPNYRDCPTCGGGMVPDTFEIKVVTDTNDGIYIEFFDEEAEVASRNFLPWVIRNQGRFEDIGLDEFLSILEVELVVGGGK